MDDRHFNCVGCHRNLPVSNFDFKPNTTTPYSRCKICRTRHNESYVKRQIPFEKSFASFEEKTPNGTLKVECWHPTENGDVNPRNVSIATHNKYWFKCPECPHDFDIIIHNVTSNNSNWCRYCAGKALCDNEKCIPCFEKSFASFEEKTPNSKLKVDCWHPTRNGDVKPRDIAKGTEKKYWFKCQECPHDFDIDIHHVTSNRGRWCRYCAGQALCDNENCIPCFEKSFASFEEKTPNDKLKVDCWHPTRNGDVKPRDISKGTHYKYWFTCPDEKCKHDFDMHINSVTRNNACWCRYCAVPSKVLCADNCIPCFEKSFASFEGKTPNDKLKVDCWHPTRNGDVKPRDISKGTHNKFWFKCPDEKCGHDFKQVIDHITCQGYWCPTCKNKTEKKFYKYLLMLATILSFNIKSIEKQYRPLWANQRQTHGTFYEYDFYIVLTNGVQIIFEIDGPQHYKKISNWGSVLKNQIRDEIKTRLAMKQEINLVRLNQEDVLYDKNNWTKIVNDFIQKKYECNDEIEIYDCADGERYQ